MYGTDSGHQDEKNDTEIGLTVLKTIHYNLKIIYLEEGGAAIVKLKECVGFSEGAMTTRMIPVLI